MFGGVDALENGQYLAAGKQFYSAGDSAAVLFEDDGDETIETDLPEGYVELPDGYAPDGQDLLPYSADGVYPDGNASGESDLLFEYPTESPAPL